MTNEEIVKELREVIDCIANEEPITATRTALTIIEKLQPKPLFKVGPAKTTGDNLVVIHEIHEGFIFGRIMNIPPDRWFSHSWHDSGEDRFGCSCYKLLPNNEPEQKYKCKNCGGEINKGEFDTFELCDGCWDKPEEKVYGPQKCNETVKLCMNCEHDMVEKHCLTCSNRDKWAPIPTDGEIWDRVKAVEKAHKDAGNSKLKFGDVAGSKKELTTEDKKPVKGEVFGRVRTPKELTTALRQFRHNNSDEFVFGFGHDEMVKIWNSRQYTPPPKEVDK